MELERDRLKHLLIILLEALSNVPDEVGVNRSSIQDKVAAAGLDEADVNGLLDWIEAQWPVQGHNLWPEGFGEEISSHGGVRFFGESEREYLSPGALGFLIELHNSQQINRAQFEALLQYASFVSVKPLERSELQIILEQVLFRPRSPGLTGGSTEGLDQIH